MKRVGGCTVPLADWPLFHCIGQVVGGGGGLLRINYEDLKFHLCLMSLWGFFGTCKYIYM